MNFLKSEGLMQNRTVENAVHAEAVSVWMSAVCVYFSIVGHGETAQGSSLYAGERQRW